MWRSTPRLHTSLDITPRSEAPFVHVTSVAVFFPSLLPMIPPLHLSLLSRNHVSPPGLAVEHKRSEEGDRGVFFVFRWLSICLAGVEGRKPETPLCPHLASREVTACGDSSQIPPTEPQCLLYQSHIRYPLLDFLAPGRSRPSPPYPL